MNVTVPVGVPGAPVEVTVAVKVTAWPALLGLADDASVVVVPVPPGWLTSWVSVGDVLAPKLLLPE